jgi:hypothetical protein
VLLLGWSVLWGLFMHVLSSGALPWRRIVVSGTSSAGRVDRDAGLWRGLLVMHRGPGALHSHWSCAQQLPCTAKPALHWGGALVRPLLLALVSASALLGRHRHGWCMHACPVAAPCDLACQLVLTGAQHVAAIDLRALNLLIACLPSTPRTVDRHHNIRTACHRKCIACTNQLRSRKLRSGARRAIV